MKKGLIWAAGILLLIIVSIQIVLLAYHNSLRVKVEKELDKGVNAQVTFDDFKISLFNHFPNVTLELRNFCVVGVHEFEGDTLITASSVGMEVSLLALLKQEIKLRSVLLDEPQINLEVREDGNANYKIFKSDTASLDKDEQAFKIDIDQVTINQGNLVYEDRSNQVSLTLTNVHHKGAGNFNSDIFDYSTQTEFQELTFTYQNIRYLDKKQMSLELAMQVDMRANKFTIIKNSFVINHFKLGVEGVVSLLQNGYDVDLKYATQETSFKNILSLLPGIVMKDMEHITTEGQASLEGFVKGKYSITNDTLPVFHADLKIKDGYFKVDSLPTALNKIQCDMVIDNPTGLLDQMVFDLRTIHLEVGDQPVHGTIKVQGIGKFKIEADLIAGLNLHEIENIYPIKGIDLKGRADLEFKASGNFVRGIENGPDKRDPVIPSFNIDLKVANASIRYDSLPADINTIRFHLNASNKTGKVENTSVTVEDMSLKLDSHLVSGYAKVEGFTSLNIDADLKGSLDVADLERIFPIKGLLLKGNLNIDINAKGKYDQYKGIFPLVDAHFDFKDGYVKSDDYPEPIQDVHLIAEAFNKTGFVKDTQLNVKQFTYTLEGEPFVVSGTISDFEKYAYDFKIKGAVDLEKLTAIYPLKDIKLSGRIFSNIETKGKISDLEKGNYAMTSTQGFIRLKDMELSGKEIPLAIKISDAAFLLSPEKITLKRLEGKLGKSNIKATGDLYNYMYFVTKNNDLIRGDMVVECDTLDLNEWISQRTVSATSGDSLKSNQQLTLIEIPKNIDFVFDSDIKNVHYDDVKITSLDGEITVRDGVMKLHETGFNSLNAKFNINGDYDTRDLAHPLFDFDMDIKELDIARAYKEIKLVRDLAPAAANCEGQFSITYSLKGELEKNMNPRMETVIGGGQLRIANAKIDGMKIFEELSKVAKRESMNNPHLKDFVMDTEIRDNKIFVKPFSIKVSGFNTEIEGVSTMEGAIQYLVKVELLPIEKLKIPFHIAGTYDDPKVAIGKGHKLPE